MDVPHLQVQEHALGLTGESLSCIDHVIKCKLYLYYYSDTTIKTYFNDHTYIYGRTMGSFGLVPIYVCLSVSHIRLPGRVLEAEFNKDATATPTLPGLPISSMLELPLINM